MLTFVVWKDGRITNVKVTEASTVEAFNRSALDAVTVSNPAVPLPAAYPDKNIRMTVTFYFNPKPKSDQQRKP